ncbi:MAG: hypothetical protein Q4B57_01730 [Eubacteriales bacterium]|nr:hypothetical protein [Eubacteriales bacterium]
MKNTGKGLLSLLTLCLILAATGCGKKDDMNGNRTTEKRITEKAQTESGMTEQESMDGKVTKDGGVLGDLGEDVEDVADHVADGAKDMVDNVDDSVDHATKKK